jgi:hypothetical protein
MTTFTVALVTLSLVWAMTRLLHRTRERDLGAMSQRWLAEQRLTQAPDPQR